MRNLYVPLSDETVTALRELARREFRGPKEQAAFLIADGLKRAGLQPSRPERQLDRSVPER